MLDGVTPLPKHADPALVKALARAHRYQRMLDQGLHASLTELAAAEKVDRSFLGKLLSLTLLAPDLVETILVGRCDAGLPSLLRPFPASWHEQASILAAGSSPAWPPATERLRPSQTISKGHGTIRLKGAPSDMPINNQARG